MNIVHRFPLYSLCSLSSNKRRIICRLTTEFYFGVRIKFVDTKMKIFIEDVIRVILPELSGKPPMAVLKLLKELQI